MSDRIRDPDDGLLDAWICLGCGRLWDSSAAADACCRDDTP